jgi:ADP-heptose:LPS heptosyltransferase
MKKIDGWAGGLGCFALDVVEVAFGWLRRSAVPPDRVRMVLVTKYLGMGSIVLAAPMVARLRLLFPGARIVFLTFRENREVAQMLGIFDLVFTIEAKSLPALVRDTISTLRALWRLKVDVVCDLEFFTRYSTLVAWLSGAPRRVGYFSRIAWRGHLLTDPVYYNGTKHITRVFLAQAEVLGARIDEAAPVQLPDLPVDPAADAGARTALRAAGVDEGQPFLAVNPNASELCLERRWMPERFARVVDALLVENPSMRAVFVGSPGEAAYTQSVIDRCRQADRVVNLAGGVKVRELAELLRAAHLLLTNDSGPLHLAAMVGTPTVSLFGPETPTLYGPVGPRQQVFYSGVYCSPCINVYNSKTASCRGNNICLQAFSGHEVLNACRQLLGETRLPLSTVPPIEPPAVDPPSSPVELLQAPPPASVDRPLTTVVSS